MSILLVMNGFKCFFYANEHEPKHIHVMKGGDFAKIELDSLRIVNNYMKPKAMAIVTVHKDEFERKWDEYFSQR